VIPITTCAAHVSAEPLRRKGSLIKADLVAAIVLGVVQSRVSMLQQLLRCIPVAGVNATPMETLKPL